METAILDDLNASFAEISLMDDPVKKTYSLIELASSQDMDESHIFMLYDSYCQKVEQPNYLSNGGQGWLYKFESLLKKVVNWMSHFSLFSFLEYMGTLLILGAIFSFFYGIPERNRELRYEAIETIEAADGTPYNSARFQALVRLNQQCVDLDGLKLSKANLNGIDLTQCMKDIINHKPARLQGASLDGVLLNDAVLRGIDLKYANLSDAQLKNADLSGADLRHSNFSGADLFSANLSGADLRGADFSNSTLNAANLQNTKLEGAIFFNAKLAHANLNNSYANKTDFTCANLSGARLKNVDFFKSSLKGSRLNKALINENTFFEGVDISKYEKCLEEFK